MYTDPDLAWQENSAEIGPAMIDQVVRMLAGIRWARKDIAAFLGSYLTEPKPTVFFEPPEMPVDYEDFAHALGEQGAALDPRSLLLWSETAGFHLNGEALTIDRADHTVLKKLAHQRSLSADTKLSPAVIRLLYDWYFDGFLHLENAA
jgi:50S ribosomal protein L16 3-hydroxylase